MILANLFILSKFQYVTYEKVTVILQNSHRMFHKHDLYTKQKIMCCTYQEISNIRISILLAIRVDLSWGKLVVSSIEQPPFQLDELKQAQFEFVLILSGSIEKSRHNLLVVFHSIWVAETPICSGRCHCG